MVLAEFSMFPTDKGVSKSKYVSQVIDVIDQSGITYLLTPMGTILEGTWDEVMAVITKCQKTLESQCARINTQIKIDYREGDKTRMNSKIEKVETLIGREIKHS